MRKNINFKRILRIISSVIIILLVVSIESVLCNHPNNLVERNVNSFYNEKENTLDYVVMGSSAAQYGIFPAIIWKENEITGNTLCVDGCNSKIYLSLLKEILSTQKNAIIVVDMDGFNYTIEHKEFNSKSFWIDTMKRNENWKETINRVDKENKIEHYLPILKYHKNFFHSYNNISISIEKLFGKSTDSMKGAGFLNENRLPEDEMKSLVVLKNFYPAPNAVPQEREALLYEFLNYCKDNKVKDVLFCDFPKAYSTDEKYADLLSYEEKGAYNEKIIKEYGYNVLNFNKLNNPCKLTKEDFADSYHLKYTGAIKISNFLGNYIKENYDINEKNDQLISKWNKSTEEAYKKYNL